MKSELTRRELLKRMGAGTALGMLGGLPFAPLANAAASAATDYRLVLCYLEGGADQLMALDG